MSDEVRLTVNGKTYAGWKSVRIEAGLERVARSFEVSVTDQWPGSTDKVRRIAPGDLCEVSIGDDLVCTGYVDATPIYYDASGYSLIIRGRSKTADLVDCSADNASGQFRGLTLDAIAAKLAGQYGLGVVAEAATGAVISDHQIQQGESVFESLDRLAKQRHVLITDNAAGNVVIASPGSGGQSSDSLALGVNILSGSAGFDYSSVYSKYTVKGQKSGSDDSFGIAASQTLGQASDSSIKRKRVLIVRQSGQADAGTCQQRAGYEQQVRAAKAGEIRYSVAGWRQTDGSLWRPNQNVRIDDDLMAVHASLLISECIWTLDEGGQLTELVAIPAAAFLTEPETQAKKTKKGASADHSLWEDL
jgi:prophage tail gpP-like protein